MPRNSTFSGLIWLCYKRLNLNPIFVKGLTKSSVFSSYSSLSPTFVSMVDISWVGEQGACSYLVVVLAKGFSHLVEVLVHILVVMPSKSCTSILATHTQFSHIPDYVLVWHWRSQRAELLGPLLGHFWDTWGKEVTMALHL